VPSRYCSPQPQFFCRKRVNNSLVVGRVELFEEHQKSRQSVNDSPEVIEFWQLQTGTLASFRVAVPEPFLDYCLR